MIETRAAAPEPVYYSRHGTFDRAEIDNIKKTLRELRARVDALFYKANITPIDEEQGAPTGPLTADQLRKRNERDASRRERITDINLTAQAKMGDIRKKMGK